MQQLLKVFFMGMTISFLGSIPLGAMNVAATEITIRNGIQAAFAFSTAAMLVEIIYVRIGLVAINRINKHRGWYRFFEGFTILIILALAAGSFIAAARKAGLRSALPVHIAHPFLTGALLSATNPMPVSFWFGWSSILLNKNILLPQKNNYNVYTAGIGIGTLLGFALFIFGGDYLVNHVKANEDIINWIIGFVLLITALVQLYKMIRKPLPPKTNAHFFIERP